MNRNKTPADALLATMDRHEFVLSVERAEREAADAQHVRAVMSAWARRLAPYLDRDPEMTVAQALARYRTDHPDRP